MQVGQRRALGHRNKLPALLHLAVAATDNDVRNWIVVVLVAIAHIRSIKEDRMVKDRAVAIWYFCQLLQERSEAVHMPRLNLHQLVNSLEIVGMVRNGMERIRNTDVIVGLVRALGDHDVGNNARQVRLVSENGQIKK